MNRRIFQIALPSIISNVTVPLLGLIDVAIVGHLGNAVYIGAISVGGMVFNLLYWFFAFLRMGTSGMTSQAFGARRLGETLLLLRRSLSVALMIAMLLLLFRAPLCSAALLFISPSKEVASLAQTYLSIGIWGAPAVLCLYGLTGWFIGMQNTKLPMVVSIVQNVVNIIASLFFVIVMGMKVEGVALGTVVAQWTGLLTASVLFRLYYGRLRCPFSFATVFQLHAILRFFRLNTDIFLRTLCMISVMLYFTTAGARQGNIVLAVNTLMMQFFLILSYFMDGFAYAGEALCGRFVGAANQRAFRATVRGLHVWGVSLAVTFTLLYLLFGQPFTTLLTDDAAVLEAVPRYFPWVVLLPMLSFLAFIWDGVYIGATATRQMLVSLFISAVVFFASYALLPSLVERNHALWIAFLLYIFSRGVVQTVLYKGVVRRLFP